MNFEKTGVRSSPYIGVFCTATDETAIVPHSATHKETRAIEETLEVQAIKASLGGSPIIGVLSKGIGKKIAVSGITTDEEKKHLEKQGLEVLRMGGYGTTGNLIALNKHGAITSPFLSDEETRQLEAFFGVKTLKMPVGESNLAGACITVTNKGFICNPNIAEKEFHALEKLFRIKGKPTTANYGDLFVGNSVTANTKGAIVGYNTSGIELAKIDEALRGE